LTQKFLPYITDEVDMIEDAKKGNQNILVEGANAVMLDIDFGTYPFVGKFMPNSSSDQR